MGELLNYKEEIIRSMTYLGLDERTIFLGQTVAYEGSAMYGTLSYVPMDKRIEIGIAEDMQMGMSTGLSLEGFIPITIYPRFDFLILATNQMVNHLDKICELSDFRPKVIIRTSVGSKTPLDGGIQHTSDYTGVYKMWLNNIEVIRFDSPRGIFETYKKALEDDKSYLLIERAELYEVDE